MLSRARPKRNRYVQIGLFIIIYTFYYVYSADTIDTESSEKDEGYTSTLPTTSEVGEMKV